MKVVIAILTGVMVIFGVFYATSIIWYLITGVTKVPTSVDTAAGLVAFIWGVYVIFKLIGFSNSNNSQPKII